MTGQGSIFNDFDHNPMDLLLNEDFMESEEDVDDEERVENVESGIDDQEIERAFLAADDADYERWTVDHELFDSESNVNSYKYMKMVHGLLSVDDWDDLPIYDDMEYR